MADCESNGQLVSHSISINGCDHWFGSASDSVPMRREVSAKALVERLADHLLDVCAGSERLFGAGYHDSSDRFVVLHVVNRFGHFTHESIAKSIKSFGSVKSY